MGNSTYVIEKFGRIFLIFDDSLFRYELDFFANVKRKAAFFMYYVPYFGVSL